MGRHAEFWPIYPKKSKTRGIRYMATVNVKGAKSYSKTFDTKELARNWLKKERSKNQSGITSDFVEYRNMTVEWLCAYWFKNYAKKRKAFSSLTRDSSLIRTHILPELGSLKFQDISSQKVEIWLGRLGGVNGRLSAKSCNHILGLLLKIYNDAVRWKMIVANPLEGIERLKIVNADSYSFWTISEKLQFLEYVAANSPENSVLFETALNTGLRCGELKALRWNNIDFDAEKIVVEHSYCHKQKEIRNTTKSGKKRHVPLTKNLLRSLRLKKCSSDSEFVFTEFDFSHSARNLKILARAAGVREIRFHDLRHTFATHFMLKGGSIYDLKGFLGHSSVVMTEKYAHHSAEKIFGKTEILEEAVTSKVDNVIPLSR